MGRRNELRDFYESRLSRVLGFLIVAVPIALVVGGVVAFRAAGAVAQGTPVWVGVILASSGLVGTFLAWRLFTRGMQARRSLFTSRPQAPSGRAGGPPIEQARQPDASCDAHDGKE